MTEKFVTAAKLTGSYGYTSKDPAIGFAYYGPGENIPIPAGLATTLGIPTDSDPTPLPFTDPLPLPADFPGASSLLAAGFNSLTDVRKLSLDDLVAIDGIGKKTAEKIQQWVGA